MDHFLTARCPLLFSLCSIWVAGAAHAEWGWLPSSQLLIGTLGLVP